MRAMEVTLRLPDELKDVLGPKPERDALEALLAELAFNGRISVAFAGQVLGLTPGESIEWYTSRGHHYPDLTDEELADELRFGSETS
jgi:hypothetical protein